MLRRSFALGSPLPATLYSAAIAPSVGGSQSLRVPRDEQCPTSIRLNSIFAVSGASRASSRSPSRMSSSLLTFFHSPPALTSRSVVRGHFPYRWKDETAITYAKERGADVASSRSRWDSRFSLAPSSLVDIPVGLRLVLPSPNGSSLAFQAMSTGAIVVAGCLRNALTVARRRSPLVGGSLSCLRVNGGLTVLCDRRLRTY